MKKLYFLILILATNIFIHERASAQCTNTVLDWDYRDFFGQHNGTITGYVSLAQCQSQAFSFGANKATITHNYTGANVAGDNILNTGSAGSFGNGADIQFTGNGSITVTFQTAVTNVQFSMYDIDRSQIVNISALNGVTPAVITTIAKLSGTILTVAGSGTAMATATTTNVSCSNSSTDGTINVSIAGPITSFTMAVTNTGTCSSSCSGGTETGVFWVSDIAACSNGSFPNNYYAVSQPFTGMPSYVLGVRNDSVYYIDPATGVSKYLFADIGPGNLNSLGYDPYNRLLYYTYSLTGAGGTVNPNEKALRRYDYDLDTFGVVVNNINTLGIPTFQQGVESGAAGFYGDCLYLGTEGGNSTESVIWKIELNASHYPIAFSQAYAQEAVSGSRIHDWSDFGFNNGVLYDFDGSSDRNFFLQNLLTGVVTTYVPAGSLVPRQTAVDWTGQMYNLGSPSASAKGTIAPYNGTNDLNYALEDTITYHGVEIVGSWGDAAEAFRPLCDFGDAPASYDPVALSPAVNEKDPNLRLGASFDQEWNKTVSALADADGSDEDAIGTVTIFDNASSTYYVQVSVFNNTGADATLIGWLDYNGNNVFDAGEASAAATVTTNAAPQSVSLNWTGISSPLATGSYTFLRIRIASTSLGMSSANATGWFDNGETEDYQVVVDNMVLPLKLLSFDAKTVNNTAVKLNWKASEDINLSGYEVQRSDNGTDWKYIGFVQASQTNGIHPYELIDGNPYKGTSYYRLKFGETGSSFKYSEIQTVTINDLAAMVTLSPNPATNKATITINNTIPGQVANVRIMGAKGNQLFYQKIALAIGNNSVDIPVQSWPSGTYIVLVSRNEATINKKLILRK